MKPSAWLPKDSLARFVLLSATVHLFAFGANQIWGTFYTKPQFAIEVAPTSIDVVIIEEIKALPPLPEVTAPIMVVKEETKEPLPVEEVKEIPVEKIEKKVIEPIKLEKVELPKEIQKPVINKIQKGALTEAKPEYLKNPAPAYPLKARQKNWEGVVLLNVLVNSAGRPVKINIEKTSGYAILDEAAVKAVNTWQFQPARLGNISIESSVKIPIRFRLEDVKGR